MSPLQFKLNLLKIKMVSKAAFGFYFGKTNQTFHNLNRNFISLRDVEKCFTKCFIHNLKGQRNTTNPVFYTTATHASMYGSYFLSYKN